MVGLAFFGMTVDILEKIKMLENMQLKKIQTVEYAEKQLCSVVTTNTK